MFRFCLVVALMTVLSGCQGSPAANPLDAPAPTTAPAPIVNESVGSIAGRVVDEESRPLPGSHIGVVGPNLQVTADSVGAYTINGLPPGKYAVVAERLGYVSTSRSAEVLVGEVTHLNFTLLALMIADAPHHIALPKVSHIQAEQGFVAQEMEYQRLANLTPLRALMCPNCYHVLYIERRPGLVRTENVWATSQVNRDMETRYMWNRTGSGVIDLGTFQWGRLTNRQAMHWSDANIKSLSEKKVTSIELTVTSSQLGASFDHKIETWTTFAYGQPLPPEYSALPPP